jgi:pectin methylesterase-like acyl-CoA thioesterase
MSKLSRIAALTLLCTGTLFAAQKHTKTPTLFVSTAGKADYNTVQAAVDAAPATGAIIAIAPGTYREVVTITKPNITLRGGDADPSKTIIVDDRNSGENGGTLHTSTVNVSGDDFHADHITFQNDFNRTHKQVAVGSQALALRLTGDRNILSHVDMLGNQDTLFAGHMGLCPRDSDPCCGHNDLPACGPVRSYFSDCVVSGNVDFIFGDGAVVFDRCEIRSTTHGGGYLTAQSRNSADQKNSVYVFNHCTLTAEPGVTGNVFLGRPWRPYAMVVYLHTTMGAHIDPAGWHEWHAGTTRSLETAYYAEYDSTGPGATPDRIAKREPNSKQLTATQAKAFSTHAVLSSPDHWDPESAR